MKTNSLELAKWMTWTIISGTLAGYLLAWTLDSIFLGVPDSFYNILPTAFVSSGLYRFYSRQLARLDNHLPVKEKQQLKATNSRSIKVNGTKEIFLSAVKSIFTTEQPEQKSMLWWEYGPYTIFEDTVYEWIRKGWNRQLKGEAHPFSCNWMIRQRFYTLSNQTIERDFHKALVRLIATYQLWLKEPRQGVAGKLRVSPYGCVAKLKGKW